MTVAFIGHRNVVQTEALEKRVTEVVTTLIEKENADTFLFGSRSVFNSICYDTVSKLKITYPHIKRIYVRAEFDYCDKLMEYLLEYYEESFFPDGVRGAGTLSYIKRNQVMVDMCDVLVVYCDMNYRLPTKTIGNLTLGVTKSTKSKSGAVMATFYAQQKKKRIINLIT